MKFGKVADHMIAGGYACISTSELSSAKYDPEVGFIIQTYGCPWVPVPHELYLSEDWETQPTFRGKPIFFTKGL